MKNAEKDVAKWHQSLGWGREAAAGRSYEDREVVTD